MIKSFQNMCIFAFIGQDSADNRQEERVRGNDTQEMVWTQTQVPTVRTRAFGIWGTCSARWAVAAPSNQSLMVSLKTSVTDYMSSNTSLPAANKPASSQQGEKYELEKKN